MHSLVFKRSELPKKMAKEVEYEKDSEGALGDNNNNLFTTEDCQSCNLEATTQQNFAPGMSLDSLRHSILPHSSTCSYGIQALINNVHRGYINESEDDPDHISSFTEEPSQWQESEILRSLH
jgi:hypothetical protein